MSRAGYAGYAAGYTLNPRSYLGFAVTRSPIHMRARAGVGVRAHTCAHAHITENACNRETCVTSMTYRVTGRVTRVTRTRPPVFSLLSFIEEKGWWPMGSRTTAAQVMPATASLVAELRAVWGAERVDAALAAGQQARREFKRLEGLYGRADADAWLARQKFPNGRLYACEGGREIGVQA